MIQFNDKNIFVGYIKELLHTFNLPTAKIFKKDSSFIYDGALFIKDNYIQQYKEDEGKFVKVSPYVFNKPIWNFTKTLRLNCNYYDSHTHAYLGEYLRFIRDYKDLDLMSMYNCFNNNVISNLVISFKYGNEANKIFKTDSNYKVYSVPVKFGKKYTIAFSTNSPIELICGIYSKGIVKKDVKKDAINNDTNDDTNDLYETTYKVISSSNFKEPFIYDNLMNATLKTKFLYDHEQDLKLFIKVPINNDTSIVVLEGEYLHTNDKYLAYKLDSKTGDLSTLPSWKHTKTVFNFKMPKPIESSAIEYPRVYSGQLGTFRRYTEFEEVSTKNINDLHFASSLQLLEINANMSFPFADRLIEYLIDNTVTNIENISDNIERIQKALVKRREDSKYHPWYCSSCKLYFSDIAVGSNHICPVCGATTSEVLDDNEILFKKQGLNDFEYAGLWEDNYKGVLYNIAVEEGIIDNKFDVLGYLDKDVEQKLRRSEVDIYEGE